VRIGSNRRTVPSAITLDLLRTYAVARSLFAPTTLPRALERLGFVQADPIRSPARAQDLVLRHRVLDYRAGELDRRYSELGIEEDLFVNYGFLHRRHLALMLPRTPRRAWDRSTHRRSALVLAFVRELGEAHPAQVNARFSHGTVTNYWGGSSNATTHLLQQMQRRGLLRVVRREAGVRVYAVRPEEKGERIPAKVKATMLLDLAFALYAPLPARRLGALASRLRLVAPQLGAAVGAALERARIEMPRARIDGVDWYWPAGEDPARASLDESREQARFLAPFDPVVWDRHRFEAFWGWAYRFEAYTPAPKRKLGYYALPLLWRDKVIGWGNLTMTEGTLDAKIGYVAGRAPRDRAFSRELDAEIERMRRFVGR
jgi:uncharacterized protein